MIMRHKRSIGCWTLIFSSLYSWSVYGQQPVPIITNTKVEAAVSFDANTSDYTYVYRVTSMPANTGIISAIELDITMNLSQDFGLPDPYPQVPQYRDTIREEFDKKGIQVVPVELSGPQGWFPIPFTEHATAAWVGPSETASLVPGNSVGGFTLKSKFLPGIRTIRLNPGIHGWNLYPDEDDTDDVKEQKQALIDSLDYVGYTLGPVGIQSFFHIWNHLRDSINQAITLGWISDAVLGQDVVNQLSLAKTAFDAKDGALAKSHLTTLISMITQANDNQRQREALDLVILLAQTLYDGTAETPIPFEPLLYISPQRTTLPLGEEYTVTARFVNAANNDSPLGNSLFFF